MSASVLIVTRPTQRGKLWRFRTSDGEKHATTNAFLASLAEEYWKAHTRVVVDSWPGWFYRECWQITPEV